MQGANVVCWAHFGDLHLTTAEEQNFHDFVNLTQIANDNLAGSVDFAFLPGDNADDGAIEQFRLLRGALDGLHIPVRIIPGDHDFKPLSLEAFYRGLRARSLPWAEQVGRYRCLFLDVVSAGTGGPDFRLGPMQLDWLRQELEAVDRAGQASVVFMHTYPADLRGDEAQTVTRLLRTHRVLAVDMGHTHYNELANDGRIIYMATRSTGQVEEGPVGFSIAALDGGVVSWRFKLLNSGWPFVMITTPADRRLATKYSADSARVRAKVFGLNGGGTVEVREGDAPWREMEPVPGETGLWQAEIAARGTPLCVRARDSASSAEDVILPVSAEWTPPARAADGSDRDRVGAWPERHILGTQLGPNRNGRKW
jgi:Icc protein